MRRTFERLSSADYLVEKRVRLDPRAWRTIYKVRMMLSQSLGFMPSFSYAVSELLIDPVRGARLMERAEELYGDIRCPSQFGPKGNRQRNALSANKEYEPGEARENWGP